MRNALVSRTTGTAVARRIEFFNGLLGIDRLRRIGDLKRTVPALTNGTGAESLLTSGAFISCDEMFKKITGHARRLKQRTTSKAGIEGLDRREPQREGLSARTSAILRALCGEFFVP